MRGEVGFARRGERVGEAMVPDRLQRVAGTALGVAVVDKERGDWRVLRPRRRGREQSEIAGRVSTISPSAHRHGSSVRHC